MQGLEALFALRAIAQQVDDVPTGCGHGGSNPNPVRRDRPLRRTSEAADCRSDPFRPTGRSTAKGSCDRTTGAVVRGTESLLTLRGRELDSNFRFRAPRGLASTDMGAIDSRRRRVIEQSPASANRSRCWAAIRRVAAHRRIRRRRQGRRCRRCERIAEPEVRIHSTPAESLQTIGSSAAHGKIVRLRDRGGTHRRTCTGAVDHRGGAWHLCRGLARAGRRLYRGGFPKP